MAEPYVASRVQGLHEHPGPRPQRLGRADRRSPARGTSPLDVVLTAVALVALAQAAVTLVGGGHCVEALRRYHDRPAYDACMRRANAR
jgi:hypothetical protein